MLRIDCQGKKLSLMDLEHAARLLNEMGEVEIVGCGGVDLPEIGLQLLRMGMGAVEVAE